MDQIVYQRTAVESTVLRDFIQVCSPKEYIEIKHKYDLLEEMAQTMTDPDNVDINAFLTLDLEMHAIWFCSMNKWYIWQNLTKPQPDYSRFTRLDVVRDRIMPVNKAYPSEELLAACRRYYQATSRRISFEYAMIDGVNDRPEDAKELLRRLKGLPAHFNLIPLNHVEESPLKPSTRAAVAAFQKILEDGGVTATVRRTLGGDIDASCGQLRRKYNQSKEKR